MILAGSQAGTRALSRFRAEAEAVARVRHPGIVQIFHVGEVTGLPYIELEYLPGGSLDRILDGTPRVPAVAAQLVAVVARAIAEAHRRGVVHRDLKPANSCSTAEGRRRSPTSGWRSSSTSDAGLAKTTAGMSSARPATCRPSRRRAGPSGSDSATDVYALGAILYELLTGRPPFRAAKRPWRRGPDQDGRSGPPSRSSRVLDRDLETICLKCLEKEPSRRYADAEGLADDLDRYLAGEPILARPVPFWERIWRMAARSPSVAALVATVVLVSAVGLVLVLWQWREAVGARQAAVRNLSEAEANYTLAHRAVEEYFTKVSESRLLNEPHMTPLRQELLKTARDFYQDFVNRRSGDPKAMADLGLAYNRLAAIDRAFMDMDEMETGAQRSRAIFSGLVAAHPDNPEYRRGLADAESLYGTALLFRGDKAAALATFEDARRRQVALGAEFPDDPRYREGLARCTFNMGVTATDLGQADRAVALLTESRDLFARGVTDDPTAIDRHRANVARCERALGALYIRNRRIKPAEEACRRALRCTSRWPPHTPSRSSTVGCRRPSIRT